MPINKETIISVFDEKLTLMQWLKTINKALEDAVLTGVEVRQKGNATYSFVVTFEDGTELESNEFVLAQGESINGATIRNGHLYLSLTNGDELDAGNLKPVTSFTINASQHLIVNYGDGTSQDLGAIFSGNVNIDGNLTANSIIENMNNYIFYHGASVTGVNYEYVYVSIVKNGNKLTIVYALNVTKTDASVASTLPCGSFTIPTLVADKLHAVSIGTGNYLDLKAIKAWANEAESVDMSAYMTKSGSNSIGAYIRNLNDLTQNKKYYVRYEVTFLLKDNMA